ncbi:hypothetical protein Tco_1054372 [Tanacetum coccineum]|uniref:Uncharacterized protein n=1 Tax=Tanacetum coccineum TaxID=301880 RepID=A0ABQ5GWK7_9ASTR
MVRRWCGGHGGKMVEVVAEVRWLGDGSEMMLWCSGDRRPESGQKVGDGARKLEREERKICVASNYIVSTVQGSQDGHYVSDITDTEDTKQEKGNTEAEGSSSGPIRRRRYIYREPEEAEERLIDDYFGDDEYEPKYPEETFRRRVYESCCFWCSCCQFPYVAAKTFICYNRISDSRSMKFGFKMLLFNPLEFSKKDLSRNLKYVVPTGRVKVPAGRYVVPTGKDNVIVNAGRTKVIPAGRTILVLVVLCLLRVDSIVS